MKKTILFIILFCLTTIISFGQERKITEDSLTVVSVKKDSMSTLTIKRQLQCQSILRKVKIIVDGHKIGKIANGETKSFKIPSGKHKVVAQIDWCKSPELSFYVTVDSTKTFSLNFNKSFFVAAYQTMFDTKNYVLLTELK
ncbi:MAG: hypothetical protein PHR83_13635 [Paludibacter sp.]|nr:hypothetical protein [Paludibacter sp.]